MADLLFDRRIKEFSMAQDDVWNMMGGNASGSQGPQDPQDAQPSPQPNFAQAAGFEQPHDTGFDTFPGPGPAAPGFEQPPAGFEQRAPMKPDFPPVSSASPGSPFEQPQFRQDGGPTGFDNHAEQTPSTPPPTGQPFPTPDTPPTDSPFQSTYTPFATDDIDDAAGLDTQEDDDHFGEDLDDDETTSSRGIKRLMGSRKARLAAVGVAVALLVAGLSVSGMGDDGPDLDLVAHPPAADDASDLLGEAGDTVADQSETPVITPDASSDGEEADLENQEGSENEDLVDGSVPPEDDADIAPDGLDDVESDDEARAAAEEAIAAAEEEAQRVREEREAARAAEQEAAESERSRQEESDAAEERARQRAEERAAADARAEQERRESEQAAAEERARQRAGDRSSQRPSPAAPSGVEVATSVRCSTAAEVELTARGDGHVVLRAGNQSANGSGTASVTVSVAAGGSINAEAQAADNLQITWEALGNCR